MISFRPALDFDLPRFGRLYPAGAFFFILVSIIFSCPPLSPAQTLYLQYSSYLGGDSEDIAYDLAVDADNCLYLAGRTESIDFPTANSYQASYNSGTYPDEEAFIAKISSGGSSILYSTFLGGHKREFATSIAVDSDENAYVTGYTTSTDFPLINAYQSTFSSSEAFVTKIAPSGSALIFSTYLGGSMGEYGRGLAIDSSNCVYVTGYTTSTTNFPVKNPYQSSRAGGSDAFITKFLSSGTSLAFSTYLGGTAADEGYGIAVNSECSPHITGYTFSRDFPTQNPYQASFAEGTSDAFVAKLSSSGSSLAYSTYLGGSDRDNYTCYSGYGKIAIDSENCAYAAGYTASADFPTWNAYQASYAGGWQECNNTGDIFITKFSSTGSAIAFSTYLGGSAHDHVYDLALDSARRAFITGYAASSDFPTYNAYQTSDAGQWEVFLSGLSSDGSSLVFSSYLGGSWIDIAYGLAISSNNFYVGGWSSSFNFPTLNPYQASFNGGTDIWIGDAFYLHIKWITPTPPTPTPTPSPSPTSTPTPEGYKTPTPSPSATSTPRPTATPSPSPTCSATPTAQPTTTPSPTPTCGPSVAPYRAVIAGGDFNGDGTSDIAIFRPAANLWSVRNITRAYFGGTADLPVPGDFDGNGRAEIAIYRPSAGLWSVFNLTRAYFGLSTDLPVPGDYNGDGSDDIGVFRGSAHQWNIRNITRIYLGAGDDWPIPGDYVGEGTARAALFRPSSGIWVIQALTRFYFGGGGDWPVGGDWAGDGTWRAGLFRSCAGMWALKDLSRIYFGNCLDYPRPADFNGDGEDDIAIFRPSTGQWKARGVTSAYFGGIADIPVTR